MTAFTTFKDKVAVVTGGASGIGKGIARQFIAEGMQVIIADIEEPRLNATAKEIGATAIRTDVRDPASVRALAEDVSSSFGTVHVVCNNAGVGAMGNIADLAISDWSWMLEVNLWGVIHGVDAFLPILRRNAEGGHIVNTASLGGLATMPGLGAYCVAKAGVVALSETLAQELSLENSMVGVTVLCPGTVRTNIKTSSRNRPRESSGGALTDVDLEATEFGRAMRWADPDEVGRIVVAAIRRGDLYAFTHPEMFPSIEERFRGIIQAAQGSGVDTLRPPRPLG